MKRIISLAGWGMLLLWSACTKTPQAKVYTATEARHIVDSVKAARVAAIRKEMAIDLAIRKEIELKPLMDSLQQQKK